MVNILRGSYFLLQLFVSIRKCVFVVYVCVYECWQKAHERAYFIVNPSASNSGRTHFFLSNDYVLVCLWHAIFLYDIFYFVLLTANRLFPCLFFCTVTWYAEIGRLLSERDTCSKQ